MTRYLLTAALALVAAGSASAQLSPQYPAQPAPQYPQYPYPTLPYSAQQQPFMPNVYNPQNQPLSPYLNMLRGGNPGVNYYYGVRPGTVGGANQGGLGAPFTAGGGNRMMFFPQVSNAPDPFGPREVGAGAVLPSAGHQVAFGNTLGYFPSPFGSRGGRGGLSGVGAAPPRR